MGAITATTFVLTVEDPTRFPRARAVGSYLGLRPHALSPGLLTHRCTLRKPAISTYARCWSNVLITSSGISDQTQISSGGA
ncbi:MAG TPA: transposase [Thermoleophilia bacterium]|nr:transposase [Thermoleophilia bacterium]